MNLLYQESVYSNSGCLNKFSVFLGALSTVGALVVANFQEHSVFLLHDLGAFTLFLFGQLYWWTQLVLSFKIYRKGLSRRAGKYVLLFRFILVVVSTIIIILGKTA